MTQLTETETWIMILDIAKACGWHARLVRDSAYGYKYVDTNQVGSDIYHPGNFSPFRQWDDFHRAADALDVWQTRIMRLDNPREYVVTLISTYDNIGEASHDEQLTALCLALHQIAKRTLGASE